jgi:hypothetical protein
VNTTRGAAGVGWGPAALLQNMVVAGRNFADPNERRGRLQLFRPARRLCHIPVALLTSRLPMLVKEVPGSLPSVVTAVTISAPHDRRNQPVFERSHAPAIVGQPTQSEPEDFHVGAPLCCQNSRHFSTAVSGRRLNRMTLVN